MKDVLRVIAIIAALVALFAGGVLTERYVQTKAPEIDLPEWQPIEPDNYFIASPPGMMWVFRVEMRDGVLQWQRFLVAIPEDIRSEMNGKSTNEERRQFEIDKEKRMHHFERRQWDRRKGGHTNSDDVTIETSAVEVKKKPKAVFDSVGEDGILGDTNGDGVLHFSMPLVLERFENGAEVLFTSYKHICCLCKLTHEVSITVYRGPAGGFRIAQRWAVNERETKWRRLKEGLDNPRPFGAEFREPPDLPNQPD